MAITKLQLTLGASCLTVLMAFCALPPKASAASHAGKNLYRNLYNFSGDQDANGPYGIPVLDAAGNLYGTTDSGGTYGNGTVFQLLRNGDGTWTENVLHSFNDDGQDGTTPFAGVTLDSAGHVYGATVYGGAYGYGVVFQLSPNGDGTWAEDILHAFNADGQDGFFPYGDLLLDESGNLFGTTAGGGSSGDGTFFELSPQGGGQWTEKILYSFQGGGDGDLPFSGLTRGPAGTLYGVTSIGGFEDFGTVFQLTPKQDGTWTEKVIHTFKDDSRDGLLPENDLVLDSAGRLYGSTPFGGAGGEGVVFRLTPKSDGHWREDILQSFSFQGRIGAVPGALAFDAAGSLYGVADEGGAAGAGTLFKLRHTRAGWQAIVQHTFANHPGATPVTMIFDGRGHFFGTTAGEDSSSHGGVFEFIP